MRLIVALVVLAVAPSACANAQTSTSPPPTAAPTVAAAAASVPPRTAGASPSPTGQPTSSKPAPSSSAAPIDVDLVAAVKKTLAAKTAKIDAVTTYTNVAKGTALTSRAAGRVSFDGRTARLVFSGTRLGALDGEAIIGVRDVYLRNFSPAIVPAGTWVHGKRDGTDAMSKYLAYVADNMAPAGAALAYLYGAAPGTVRNAGRAVVDGDVVQRVTATCDLDEAHRRLLADGDRRAAAAIAQMRLQGFEAAVQCDASVDADGRIRSVKYSYVLRPDAPIADGTTEYRFTDFGKAPDLRVPDGDLVVPATAVKFPG